VFRKMHSVGFTLVLMVALGATAVRAETGTVESGQTSVKLSAAFAGALASLGVTAGVVDLSRLFGGSVTFPVTGGAVDLATARGEIAHSGGLTLSAGGTEVRLQSFTIDTTSAPVLTGLVVVNDGLVGRVPLFDLQLPSGITLPLKPSENGKLRLKDVGVTLTSVAAGALNQIFHVKAFTSGFNIGTANVKVVFDHDRDSDDK
jgi:hypothetical protein